jgi:hypothetical protein
LRHGKCYLAKPYQLRYDKPIHLAPERYILYTVIDNMTATVLHVLLVDAREFIIIIIIIISALDSN